MMWCGGEGGGEHDLPAWGGLMGALLNYVECGVGAADDGAGDDDGTGDGDGDGDGDVW